MTDRYTVKMKDRMKFILGKDTNNSFYFIVSGKEDTTFTFSKKRAAELILHLKENEGTFQFRKTTKGAAGCLKVFKRGGTYTLIVNESIKKETDLTVFSQDRISERDIKHIIKVMKEVYRFE